MVNRKKDMRFRLKHYLHFVGRKDLDVHIAGDERHHLQFHVYGWHPRSRLEGEATKK